MKGENAGSPAFDEVSRFVIGLGVAAHAYGSTAARLETFLSRLTAKLGFRGLFRSTPTEIVFAFQENQDPWQRTHVAAVPEGELDLNRLAAVGELVDAVVSGKVSVAEGTARLGEIERLPHPWGKLASAASFAFAGVGFAALMSGGWWDVGVAAVLSLVVFGMVTLAGRCGTRTAEWLPLSSAFVAGAVATLFRMLVPELNVVLVTLCGVLILIPGYGISVGVVELVSQHVLSGTSRLVSGLVYLAKQFAGAWLGVRLVSSAVWVPQAATAVPVAPAWLWVAVPLLIVALCVAFQTARRDFIWAALVSAGAYGGIVLGRGLVGVNVGNLLGTVVAVVLANLWERRTRRPTSIVLLPAIVLLVSGSIGFRGLAALAIGETALGQEQFLQMFVVALTIAAGLVVGNTLVRPAVSL